MEKTNSINLSIAIIVSSLILGLFFYLARQQNNTVNVVGYAIESFESDIVKWNFNVTEEIDISNLKTGYISLNEKLDRLKKIIHAENLEDLEIIYKPIGIEDIYDRNGITTNKKLSQEVIITSKSIEKIEELSTNPIVFINNNIIFQYSNINYFYTNLDLIKKELLGKAVINAKQRATEILSAAGNKVGDLRTARSGVFQITEPLSTEVAGYGVHSTATRKKNIKVTVSAEFEIK